MYVHLRARHRREDTLLYWMLMRMPVVYQAIVFVVDRLDTARVGVVREEFRNMIEHKDVRSKSHPILVLLNKSDCPPAAGKVVIVRVAAMGAPQGTGAGEKALSQKLK